MSLERFPLFARKVIEQTDVSDGTANSRELSRKCDETAAANGETQMKQELYRLLNEQEAAITDSR